MMLQGCGLEQLQVSEQHVPHRQQRHAAAEHALHD